MPACGRGGPPRFLQALQHDPQLLVLRPTSATARLHHLEPANLRSVRMTIHTHSAQPKLSIKQGGPSRMLTVYVSRVLVPELRPGDIVILDHLPAHTGSRVREAIAAAGASLLDLPPDSSISGSNRAHCASLSIAPPRQKEQNAS